MILTVVNKCFKISFLTKEEMFAYQKIYYFHKLGTVCLEAMSGAVPTDSFYVPSVGVVVNTMS